MPSELDLGLKIGAGLLGAYLAVLWLSLAVWTYQDLGSRSRDGLAQALAALLVLVFSLPGLILYLLLRPRETLAEAYERSLQEESLLQAIEEQLVCPNCRRRVEPEYLVCPTCRTHLKRPCPSCQRPLQLRWEVCPYCGQQEPMRSREYSTPAFGG